MAVLALRVISGNWRICATADTRERLTLTVSRSDGLAERLTGNAIIVIRCHRRPPPVANWVAKCFQVDHAARSRG
jgi:hypothetical protein